jgi:MFS family permease
MEFQNKSNIKWVIVFMSFCQGLQFSVSPVLQKIQITYPEVSRELVQMLITAPAIMATIIAVLSGVVVSIVGKKKLVLLGTLICAVSGLIPFFIGDFGVLFGSRIVLGIGLGIVTVLNTAVVAEHFHGRDRINVMGLQGASIGGGMLLISFMSGILGEVTFEYAYLVHVLALIAFLVVIFLLPDKGREEIESNKSIRLNKKAYVIAVLTFVEFIFLISFSTNIAMHISGKYLGDSAVAGIIIGVFSAIQILCGLFLGYISKWTKQYTLYIAMLCFSFGAFTLVLFSDNYAFLIVGALLCGASQGIFIPRAMYEISNAVDIKATALAAAAITVMINIGQLISPIILNYLSLYILGEKTTTNVFIIGMVVMFLLPMFLIIRKKGVIRDGILNRN